MTAPVQVALVGRVRMGEIRKEQRLECWQRLVDKTGLQEQVNKRMEHIERQRDGFVTTTRRGRHRARAARLAIGRRGTPRRRGVPGEALPKIVYRLVDAGKSRGQAVLAVVGRDSALHAALALADQPRTPLTLGCRSAAFSRVKDKNRQRVQQPATAGRLQVPMCSRVQAIEADAVARLTETGALRLTNQAVVGSGRGERPTPRLQRAGVQFATPCGTA